MQENHVSTFEELVLSRGRHKRRSDGMCVMEAAAWLAGEPHSDHPACVCPVIQLVARNANDSMPIQRWRTAVFKPLINAMINTVGDDAQMTQRYMLLMDWLIRVVLYRYIELISLPKLQAFAKQICDLPPTTVRNWRNAAMLALQIRLALQQQIAIDWQVPSLAETGERDFEMNRLQLVVSGNSFADYKLEAYFVHSTVHYYAVKLAAKYAGRLQLRDTIRDIFKTQLQLLIRQMCDVTGEQYETGTDRAGDGN